jgi:hypothetical protein
MCKYITHLRVCYVCDYEDTVLISERSCRPAKRTGAFGSCDGGIAYETRETQHQCWHCKENVYRISQEQSLQQIKLH